MSYIKSSFRIAGKRLSKGWKVADDFVDDLYKVKLKNNKLTPYERNIFKKRLKSRKARNQAIFDKQKKGYKNYGPKVEKELTEAMQKGMKRDYKRYSQKLKSDIRSGVRRRTIREKAIVTGQYAGAGVLVGGGHAAASRYFRGPSRPVGRPRKDGTPAGSQRQMMPKRPVGRPRKVTRKKRR